MYLNLYFCSKPKIHFYGVPMEIVSVANVSLYPLWNLCCQFIIRVTNSTVCMNIFLVMSNHLQGELHLINKFNSVTGNMC